MYQLVSVSSIEDIPREIKGTPPGLLLEYHNLQRPFDVYSQAQLLIGMCMDHRKSLRHPDNFAYIIRSGGANLRDSDFYVSFAIAVGGVSAISLIGHTNCGMVNLESKQDEFVVGLQKRGEWDQVRAEEHFVKNRPKYEIENEVNFVLSEANRLRLSYPGVEVVPMIYRVEDNLLHLIRKEED
jgi:carbonic anhydrase